jgi:two-component system, cell cycle response regulator
MVTDKKRVRVLVVDDDASLRKVVSQVLTEDGHDVTTASSAEKAYSLFQEQPFPLVFSDIRMGNMSGIELLQLIKEHSPDAQVIIMTSNATSDNTIAALRAGAYDYLLKPFEDIDLISKVANRAIDKMRLLEENSSLMKQLEQKNEELKKANSVLKERSLYDELTEVYNARFFQEVLKLEIAKSTRFKRTFSLLLIDVDHFASYNNANGRAEGDKVLCMLASILAQGLRKVDVIVRYGGEEFIVLLPEIDGDKALVTAEKIRAYVSNYPFPKSESQPQGRLSVSIGVVSFPQDGTTGAALLQFAGDILLQAKKNGRNTVMGGERVL